VNQKSISPPKSLEDRIVILQALCQYRQRKNCTIKRKYWIK